jgi:hypothetical protein
MMMPTSAQEVQIKYKVTRNFPKNDLFIEVDDLKGNPVAVFNGTDEAAKWLAVNNFQYVHGTSGVWSRGKDSIIPGVFNNGMYGGRAMMWDGPSPSTKSIYRRRSIFTLDTISLALTVALCAAAYVVLG